MEKNKPIFKNTPNTRVMSYYNDFQGVKIKRDYWISRAPAVVGIIFAFGIEASGRVLVIRRSAAMREEPLKFGAPSGYLDWDETGFDGMTREVYEETSLYLPDFKPFLIFDNQEQPFFVQSDPTKDRNQNISLTYIMAYDFTNHDEFFPVEIEDYHNRETDRVTWMKLTDFYGTKKEWAFNHDERIKTAFHYFNNNYKWKNEKNK